MIYVTGDCHGRLQRLINFAQNLTNKDGILVLGDLGLCWRKDKLDMYPFIRIWEGLKNNPMLYFIDGNHENFDILETFKDGYISPHIRYLTRGTITKLDNKNCLFMGGADSIDKHLRTEHLSWWKEEQITEENIEGIKCDVDYVFTHCCPYDVFLKYKAYLADPRFFDLEFDNTSEKRLEKLSKNITFKHWWFGHYHQDIDLDDTFSCLYNEFKELK